MFAGKQALIGMHCVIQLQSECLHHCCAREMLFRLFQGNHVMCATRAGSRSSELFPSCNVFPVEIASQVAVVAFPSSPVLPSAGHSLHNQSSEQRISPAMT